jgi:hypothetical protein
MAHPVPKANNVLASCPECGDVRLLTKNVTVYRLSTDGQMLDRAWMGFKCSECWQILCKDLSPWQYKILMENDAPSILLRGWPAELREAHKPGRFVIDDILTLRNALDDNTAFERITASV